MSHSTAEKIVVCRYVKERKRMGKNIEEAGDYFWYLVGFFFRGVLFYFLGWRIFISTASCTCSSPPGVILQILRGSLSESATQSLVCLSAFVHVSIIELLISCLVY